MTHEQDHREEADVTADGVLGWMQNYISNMLDIPTREIGGDARLDQLSLDSAMITALTIDMEDWLSIEIPLALFFERQPIGEIAERVAALVTDGRTARADDL